MLGISNFCAYALQINKQITLFSMVCSTGFVVLCNLVLIHLVLWSN